MAIGSATSPEFRDALVVSGGSEIMVDLFGRWTWVFLSFVGLVLAVLAWASWHLRPWAWHLTLAVYGIGVVGSLWQVSVGIPEGWVAAVVNGAVVVYAARPKVRRAYGPGAPDEYPLRPIGVVRSSLRSRKSAPRQGSEGAPDAWLEMDPAFVRGLHGIAEGDELVVITWLHRADRETLEVHPRNDPAAALAGVFATRSPDRPNPLGLHRVLVREVAGTRLRIGPIEAIDGTPVVDVKPVIGG